MIGCVAQKSLLLKCVVFNENSLSARRAKVVSSEPNSITWMIEMDIRKKLGDSIGASIRTDDRGRQELP